MRKLLSSHTLTPFVVALCFFMEGVDSTIVNTAIPAMAQSLSVDPVDLKLVLISYLLGLSIFIPISGWLADKFGIKTVFITGLTIFTLSSIWCGFATGVDELVIARFIQGFGGALGLPVGRLIIVRTFGREGLIAMMGRVVTIGAIGPLVGPVMGGVLTTHFSWHWIFWVNIPVGIFAIMLAMYCLQENKIQSVPRLDYVGFLLFSIALAGFSLGLGLFSDAGFNSLVAGSIIFLSVLLFLIYFLHSRRRVHPIIKTDLLQIRTFRVSVVANLSSRLGFGGVPFLLPLLLQIGLGFSAQKSGLLLMPIILGLVVGKPFVMPILRSLGYKKFLIMNTVLAGLAIWGFSCINLGTPISVMLILTGVYGFILTLQYSSMNSLAYANITPADWSAATSIMSTLQQVAQSFGVAISALFIRLFTSIFAPKSMLTPVILHYTFIAIGLFTLLSSLVFLKLQTADGKELIQ